MTIEELAEYSGVKPKTVRRNINKIKGITEREREIPDGSRYPYNLRRNKLDNMEKRRDALLDATFHCQYIDAEMLHLPQNELELIVKELVNMELLQPNGSSNKYGVNQYNTTCKYDEIRRIKGTAWKREIAMLFGTATGSFYSANFNPGLT